MKLERIRNYGGWTINNITTYRDEVRENYYATYEEEGVERCIGVNTSKGIHRLDRSNPTGYENGIGTIEELLDLIDEKGNNLIRQVKDELERKRLEDLEREVIYFEQKGKARLEELRGDIIKEWAELTKGE